MNSSRPLTIAAATLLTLAGLASGNDHVAVHEVHIVDVSTRDRSDSLDIEGVQLLSDGATLTVRIASNQNFDDYLRTNQATNMMTLAIDTDRDAGTGGQPFGIESGGFEAKVRFLACIEYDGGEACGGKLNNLAFAGTFPKFEPARWEAATEGFATVHGSFWEGGRGSFEGNTAILNIPYEDLAVASGQVVHVLVVGSVLDELGDEPVALQLK